jgi:hypothetical protein
MKAIWVITRETNSGLNLWDILRSRLRGRPSAGFNKKYACYESLKVHTNWLMCGLLCLEKN